MWKSITILLVLLIFTNVFYGQDPTDYNPERIQEFVDAEKPQEALLLLEKHEAYFKKAKDFDTLGHYIYFHGKIETLKNASSPVLKSEEALQQLTKLTTNPEAIYHAYTGMGLLMAESEEHQTSYDFYKKANTEAEKLKNDFAKLSKSQYSMAAAAYRMRKLDLTKIHAEKAYAHSLKIPKPDPGTTYNAANMMGLMMQNENKLDSALYYYDKGLAALAEPSKDPLLTYNFPAVVNSNMGIVLMNQGKFSESIERQKESMRLYSEYIKSGTAGQRLPNVQYNYLSNINNMGSNYIKLGQIARANQLFEYNYLKAKEFFPDNSIQQVVFINQLGLAKSTNEDLDEALQLLNESSEKFKQLSGNYSGYIAYGQSVKARILYELGNIEGAYRAYKYSDSLYEQSSPGSYSFDRMQGLSDAAKFYSENGYETDALKNTKIIYDVVKRTAQEDDLETIKVESLYAEVYYNLQQYREAIEWADKSLAHLKSKQSSVILDSLHLSKLTVTPMLFKAKALYKSGDTTSVKQILKIHEILKTTFQNINTQTSLFNSDVDKNLFLYQNKEVINFSQKVVLQLYQLTKDKKYLEQLLSMHESSIYNTIRAKLNIREGQKFKGVPDSVLERERKLQDSLRILSASIDPDRISKYDEVYRDWQQYLSEINEKYPDYYALKFKSLKENLGDIQSQLPEETTVIRYLFINKQLFAFLISKEDVKLISLPYNAKEELIAQLNKLEFDPPKMAKILHQLYQKLWLPIEDEIGAKKVILIPDGQLFNLSFEMLVKKEVETFKNIAANALLNNYIFSYNYSLFLTPKNKTVTYHKNLIAFAPEFSSEMKNEYRLSISDTVAIDKTYLTLLPQPFSADLAKKSSNEYKGRFFLNNNSTETIFKKEAAEHKIIHIGTHAESNNVNPELSRLVFAKSLENKRDDDSFLYTYEIYNTNLSSNLAILTACETGKPTYQPGEGMISLAHAFNYAGSESMLTSLWEIDEQSSSEIIGYFYDELKKGLPKDEALKNSKLRYLEKAQGRTLAPQYWAGLVLIGDASPINLTKSNTLWIWIVGGIILIILIVYFLRKHQKN